MKLILTPFLVVLFLSYYASATLFVHSHVTEFGVVTHSHPFSGDASGHSHSSNSFEQIEHLSALYFTILGIAFCVALFALITNVSYTRNFTNKYIACIEHSFLRGPPSM
ncbi:MAG: hypothetical protein R3Y49_02755 [Rikenellaceae bacterium]